MSDDDQKKIESTEFIFLVAKSGTGKSFSGDYVDLFGDWKHVDGDTPLKNTHGNPHYEDLRNRVFQLKEYEGKGVEWLVTEGLVPYMEELAKLGLEAAKESDKVCISWASYFRPNRLLLKKLLLDAGAKDFSMVFLHCDLEAHMDALWKRTCRQAEQAGCTITEFAALFKMPVEGEEYTKEQFVAFQTSQDWYKMWQDPDESEQPFQTVNVTAKDATVLDSLDAAFGIEDSNRAHLSYDEIVAKVRAIDEERDQKNFDAYVESLEGSEESKEELEFAQKEPELCKARRSSLLLADKMNSMRSLSSVEGEGERQSLAIEALSRRSRQSFITTGKLFTSEELKEIDEE